MGHRERVIRIAGVHKIGTAGAQQFFIVSTVLPIGRLLILKEGEVAVVKEGRRWTEWRNNSAHATCAQPLIPARER